MNRCARNRRVFFIEEPVQEAGEARFALRVCPDSGVQVVTPMLPPGLTRAQEVTIQKQLLHQFLSAQSLSTYIAWYYTPMAMEFTSVLNPVLTVYDCMDELTAFAGAPPALRVNEDALFHQADLVFTGGAGLYESKKRQHGAVYPFPSSVDVEHFRRAQYVSTEPADQVSIPKPRLGYAGVIDERMDIGLLAQVATARPEWQIVLLGPVVKINPATIPPLSNLHLLGMKKYAELPEYLAGWEIGLLPFALNEATKFISPTKTPEYLSAGLRVISTAIRDVITPYGDLGLVRIVTGPEEFMAAAESILHEPATVSFQNSVSDFLERSSWDETWNEMEDLMRSKYMSKSRVPVSSYLHASELPLEVLKDVR